MKYLVFWSMAALGVPAMTALAMMSESLRAWLVTLLVFSLVLAGSVSINFMSMELYRGPDRGFEVTLTDLIALALALALLARHSGQVQWLPYNSLCLAALFLWCLVSTASAPQPLFGGFTLFKMLRLYLVYWTLCNCLRTGVPAEAFFRGFVFSALLLTVICLRQKYLMGLYRVHGPFDHSNTIPLFGNLMMPLLLLWGLGDRGMRQAWFLAALFGALGVVFAVLATQSRAGLALSGGALLTCLAVVNWRSRTSRVTLVSLLVFLAMVAGGFDAADTIINRVKTAPKSSAEAREEFNQAAAHMARDNLLGVGLNNFSHVLTYEDRYRQYIKVMANEKQAGVAHHMYWLTAAELGWTGLGLLLLVFLRFMWRAWRGFRRDRGLAGLVCLGLLLGHLCLHLSGFFEWALRISPVSYQFVVTAALISGLAAKIFGNPGRART